jgi:hypothetical protein
MQIAAVPDTSPFSRFTGRLAADLAAPLRDPAVRGGAVEAVEVYLGGMRRRFASASHGDGTWPDLAPSTKLKRLRDAGLRYKREKGVTRLDRLRFAAGVPLPILYVTGNLYSSLVPGEAGNVFDVLSDRIRAGSAVPYARYHQQGGGRLPRRSILVDPDAALLGQMSAPIVKGYASRVGALVSGAAA